MNKYLLWIIYWLPLFLVGLVARILSPIACMFIYRELRGDTVKRHGKQFVTLYRDNLIPQLSWLNTHDNNTDEYWYGMYGFTANKSQAWYDSSKFWRWICRVLWLQRNSAYGFNYAFFSKPLEEPLYVKEYGKESDSWWLYLQVRPSSFQFEAHHPLWKGKYNSVNIGWKQHTGKPKMLYAGRIIGIRSKQ